MKEKRWWVVFTDWRNEVTQLSADSLSGAHTLVTRWRYASDKDKPFIYYDHKRVIYYDHKRDWIA